MIAAAIDVLAAAYVLWLLFLAVMALKHAADDKRLNRTALVLAVPAVGAAGLLDIGFNWSVGLLLGVTPDLTFSQKCGRLKQADDWRAPVARWICATLLDPFQIGGHCR